MLLISLDELILLNYFTSLFVLNLLLIGLTYLNYLTRHAYISYPISVTSLSNLTGRTSLSYQIDLTYLTFFIGLTYLTYIT